MRPFHPLLVLTLMLVPTILWGQGAVHHDFACQAPGPFPPRGGTPDCKGLTSNAAGDLRCGAGPLPNAGTGVSVGSNGLGIPVQDANYARLVANGPLPVPIGGPLPRPLACGAATELAMPIPPGTTKLTFFWDFYNVEAVARPGGGFNDGLSVDVVAADGSLISHVMYVDSSRALGLGTDPVSGGREAAQPDFEPAVEWDALIPPFLPAGAYLSIVCWNGGDNAWPSHLVLDNVDFLWRTTFESQPVGPFPRHGTAGDAEGVTSNSGGDLTCSVPPVALQNPGTVISGTPNGIGMPHEGHQYARLVANGPIPVPPGGPLHRPLACQAATEILIPIPPCKTHVHVAWDFYDAESPHPLAVHNDGLSIDVVDANGNRLRNLVYADTFSAHGSAIDPVSGGRETGPVSGGPQILTWAVLPTDRPPGARLSIVCWNGLDNLTSSHAVVDSVLFGNEAPPIVPTLILGAPLGPGSLELSNWGFIPNHHYVTAVVIAAPGASPAGGWFHGLDIAPLDLVNQVLSGPPFFGVLDCAGRSEFRIAASVPAGIPLVAVTGEYGPGPSYAFVQASEVVTFVTQ